jgi:phospholipase C
MKTSPFMRRTMVGLLTIALLAGCAGGRSPSSVLPTGYISAASIERAVSGPIVPSIRSKKIKHIVFIVQENRSFDNMFYGYPGAETRTYGYDSTGKKIMLQPIGLADKYVIDHSHDAMFAACNGTGSLPGTDCQMNGFNNEEAGGGPKNPEYVYVPHGDSKPYFDMAHQWVVADHMFQSHLDESFVSHQYVIAAQAQGSVDLPDGLWGCGGGPSYDFVQTITQQRTIGPQQLACFDYQTLGDELDKAKLPWRFYTSEYGKPSSGSGAWWSGYQAVKHIYNGPDWKKDVLIPQTRFLTDVPAGTLAAFTWITPTCPNSDHVNCGGGFGPSWVASLVNTVGKSKFWDSTAIFVMWDDWGGLYDHVPPPFKDYDGNGFRVPLLVISPYAKQNYVSKVPYETASVLRFAEDMFGLGQLAAADKRANSPAADCFDFKQKPRAFVPIASPKDVQFFLNQPLDRRIPDDE